MLDDRFLTFLGQVSKLEDRIYQNGVLGFDFLVEIKPFPSDNSTVFSIGGQPAVAAGAPGLFKARWPGGEPAAGVLLNTAGGGLSYTRFWGLFRMIKQADETRPEQNQIVVMHTRGENTFLKTAVEITFRNLPGGVLGPLSSLTCPPSAAHK